MRKKLLTAWFFLLAAFGSCAQLLVGLAVQYARHLVVQNSAADVAELPDEHIRERPEDVGHKQ